MTTFPTFPNNLPGLAFPVKKTPTFQATLEHISVSGVSTAQSTQPFANYAYELPYEFLRSDTVTREMQALMSFFQAQRGRALPFHFLDPDDNAVVSQSLGIGDGATTKFALIRSIGFAADPMQDVDTGSITVFANGVSVPFTELVTSNYGTVFGVTLSAAPAAGAIITANFTYKFLCRFSQDTLELSKELYINGSGVWTTTIQFASILQ